MHTQMLQTYCTHATHVLHCLHIPHSYCTHTIHTVHILHIYYIHTYRTHTEVCTHTTHTTRNEHAYCTHITQTTHIYTRTTFEVRRWCHSEVCGGDGVHLVSHLTHMGRMCAQVLVQQPTDWRYLSRRQPDATDRSVLHIHSRV